MLDDEEVKRLLTVVHSWRRLTALVYRATKNWFKAALIVLHLT